MVDVTLSFPTNNVARASGSSDSFAKAFPVGEFRVAPSARDQATLFRALCDSPSPLPFLTPRFFEPSRSKGDPHVASSRRGWRVSECWSMARVRELLSILLTSFRRGMSFAARKRVQNRGDRETRQDTWRSIFRPPYRRAQMRQGREIERERGGEAGSRKRHESVEGIEGRRCGIPELVHVARRAFAR